jgi:hypothetical protein
MIILDIPGLEATQIDHILKTPMKASLSNMLAILEYYLQVNILSLNGCGRIFMALYDGEKSIFAEASFHDEKAKIGDTPITLGNIQTVVTNLVLDGGDKIPEDNRLALVRFIALAIAFELGLGMNAAREFRKKFEEAASLADLQNNVS